jgi:eukaryotic-like serine/threonine-protein kinase
VFVARPDGEDERYALRLTAIGEDSEPAASRWGRFERAARVLAELDQPEVIRVHAFGVMEGGDFAYLAMDLIEGRTLAELHETEGLSLERNLEVAAAVARALRCVHAVGGIHGDLRPKNVMVRSGTGLPVLCDFSLLEPATHVSLTTGSRRNGSAAFCAPESITGGTVAQGPPADVFALGVMLYVMLSGRYPFEGDGPIALIKQILSWNPPAPSADATQRRWGLDDLVLAVLAKTPADRPTASDVAERLDRALRSED